MSAEAGGQMAGQAMREPVTMESPRLEVRWIRRGPMDVAMLEWFARFPQTEEARTDQYLLNPDLDGLSVKIRAGRALEVKAYLGSRGVLTMPGPAEGRLELWQRWSFPLGSVTGGDPDSTDWCTVGKVRQLSYFYPSHETLTATSREPDIEPRCAVELTEFTVQGQQWWTLGFEAAGAADDLPDLVERTAALVFDRPLPGNLRLPPADAGSYSEWLQKQPASAEQSSLPPQ
jgi:hypothetical protein